MFTGIIETTGTVKKVETTGGNKSFLIESSISRLLKVDQSLSHNGVCLTVEKVGENEHLVTAIDETLKKTNVKAWQAGSIVNLERCLQMNGRIDGHIVQGHVDTTATCKKIDSRDGSIEITFEIEKQFAPLVIEKGSICLNGVSLTTFSVTATEFTVAIIPYTLEHTNMNELKKGDIVNIEFDIIGKYMLRQQALSH